MDFEMVQVVSKRVAELGYSNTGEAKMRAVFPNGRSGIYDSVPREVFDIVLSSPSVGSAFGALIVDGGYPFEYEN